MMKQSIVIHVDAARRDYFGCWLLKEALIRQGYEVFLTSRSLTNRLLRFVTPNIVFLSHVFTINPSIYRRLIKAGTRVFIFEVEGVVGSVNGVATTYPLLGIGYEELAGLFVWSKWTRDWLLKNRGVEEDLVHTTGSIRNSCIDRRLSKPKEFVVGLLSRFEIINTFDNRHNFRNLAVIDPEDRSYKWYFERCASDSETFAIFCKLTEILVRKGIKVSIRPHPNENIESYKFLKRKYGCMFIVDRSFDINEWIRSVSVVVGPASTAFAEAYLSGTPIITTNNIQRFKFSRSDQKMILDKFLLSSYKPKTVDELIALATDPALESKDNKQLNDYFENFYSYQSMPDPIAEIVRLVACDSKKPVRRLSKGTHRLVLETCYYLVAFFAIIVAFCSRSPSKSISRLVNYDFNPLVHKPNSLLKKLNSADS